MNRHVFYFSRMALLLAVLLLPLGAWAQTYTRIDPSDPERPFFRGVWIASWGDGMLSPEQCDEFVAGVREANLNAIFPEIRKVGDAYYLGGIEPRASNIKGPDDWDPLQYLIDLCHDTSGGKQYIEVHAWLVTMRVWTERSGEIPEGHLFDVYPETMMSNAAGETSGGGSMFADPGHPMTQDWTARVFKDVAARYDIDGIHHDYVRYPEYDSDWGHNPVSLERFRERTGFEGTPEPEDPLWLAWRRRQVSDIVRRVTGEVMEVNPDCVVSAATLNWSLEMDPAQWFNSKPYVKAQQDWPMFMEAGYLDMNVLMNYGNMQEQTLRYGDWTDLAIRHRGDRHAIIGPALGSNSVEGGFDLIREAMEKGADGINIWSWGAFSRRDMDKDEYMRRFNTELFPTKVDVPVRPWKENPTYGTIIGQITKSGEWADGVIVTVDGVETTLADGTGFYAFFKLKPGHHVVEVNGKRQKVEVVAGKAARSDFKLGGGGFLGLGKLF